MTKFNLVVLLILPISTNGFLAVHRLRCGVYLTNPIQTRTQNPCKNVTCLKWVDEPNEPKKAEMKVLRVGSEPDEVKMSEPHKPLST